MHYFLPKDLPIANDFYTLKDLFLPSELPLKKKNKQLPLALTLRIHS